ncbi:hypothetical protein EI94DRAFT_661459 [Lactarius quietus]|nr:hypothetical protein EI94DRAFT_661459 [Lactarius quietus]
MAPLVALIQTNAFIFALLQHCSPSAEDPRACEAPSMKPFPSRSLSHAQAHCHECQHYHSATFTCSPNTYTLCFQPCVFTSPVFLSLTLSIPFCPLSILPTQRSLSMSFILRYSSECI